ncbi:MAG: AAA family ATPase, partial [Parachlamydiaceae bacterium]
PITQRSESMMKVLNTLVSANVSNETIFSIFESLPIGEKHREKGVTRFEQLEREIDNAKAHLIPIQNLITAVNDPYANVGLMNFKDIMAKKNELEFIVDGLWPKGQTLILVGTANIGKSAFTLNLMFELAAKTKTIFLNKFTAIGQHTSLFIQSENSAEGYKARGTKIISAMNYDDDVVERVWFPKLNHSCPVNMTVVTC